MATKPTDLPSWATAVTAQIVEPGTSRQDSGWLAGDEPPAEEENWLNNLTYLWLLYLSDGYLQGQLGLASTISPAAISGSQNNWNPTGLSTANTVRITTTSGGAAEIITGIAGGVDGRV